jgi:hypothetical protein
MVTGAERSTTSATAPMVVVRSSDDIGGVALFSVGQPSPGINQQRLRIGMLRELVMKLVQRPQAEIAVPLEPAHRSDASDQAGHRIHGSA